MSRVRKSKAAIEYMGIYQLENILIIFSGVAAYSLIGIHEFYINKECLNLHEVIQNMLTNEKINLLATS